MEKCKRPTDHSDKSKVMNMQQLFHLSYLLILSFLLIRKSISHSYKVVCYLRTDLDAWLPLTSQDVEPSLCTHVIIGWSKINNETWEIEPTTRLSDTYYASWTKLKETNKNLKIIIAVGSIFDSDYQTSDLNRKLSHMVHSPDLRRIFVENAVTYLNTNNFDGLELTWFQPTCWLGKCNDGPPTDRQNYAELVKELHQAFANESRNRTVVVHLPPHFEYLDMGFDVRAMNSFVDFFVVKSFSFYNPGKQPYLTETSLLYSQRDPNKTVDGIVRYLLGEEVDRDKIVIGIPTFGLTFHPTTSSYEVGGPSDPKKFTKTYFLSDMCTFLKDSNWTVKKSGEGTYAYKGSQWVSFNDAADIVAKAKYVQAKMLGGVMVFDVHGDDFSGQKCCSAGDKFPWLRLLATNLQNNESNALLCPNRPLSIETMPNSKVPLVVIGIIGAIVMIVGINIIVIIVLRRKWRFNFPRRALPTIPPIHFEKTNSDPSIYDEINETTYESRYQEATSVRDNLYDDNVVNLVNDLHYEELIDNSHPTRMYIPTYDP